MASTPEPHPSPAELAELSALADGSIDPGRRAEAQGKIDAQPDLRALYVREQAVVARLAQARAEDRAPHRLRVRIDAARPARARRSWVTGGFAAGALAGLIVVLALVLPAGTPGAPPISQAAALATRGPDAPAPTPDPAAPRTRLTAHVQALAFPNWGPARGWPATGERRDRIGDREVVTVYYGTRVGEVAYSIVAAPPLTAPATRADQDGGEYFHTFRLGGRTVVTWQLAGHTCILSATRVTARVLRDVAAGSG